MTSNIRNNPLVLIADDLPWVLQGWESELTEYGIEVVKATTLKELCKAFLAHEFAAIILDGCIPGHELNTIPFVHLARGIGFDNSIVAASSFEPYREQMVRAGCSHQVPKDRAAMLVADLLSRP